MFIMLVLLIVGLYYIYIFTYIQAMGKIKDDFSLITDKKSLPGQHIIFLLVSHWPELRHMAILGTPEAGKIHDGSECSF